MTGVLLAVARISGETAPLLFTALNNQFWSTNMNAPMANLPVMIFQFAISPYEDWQQLAWGGALLITVTILVLNIVARALADDRLDEEVNNGLRRSRNNTGDGHAADASAQGRPATVPQEALVEKISIRNLDFYYDKGQALKSINLPLYDKRVTAFIGPSGCGKSTLLRVLNRMYDLYPKQRATGEVLLDGKNILLPSQDLNLLRAQVGMVFQKPTPFPMSIYDNIAFGVRLYEKLARPKWTSASRRRCAAPRCGTRSRTS